MINLSLTMFISVRAEESRDQFLQRLRMTSRWSLFRRFSARADAIPVTGMIRRTFFGT